jgi:ribosomal protein L4
LKLMSTAIETYQRVFWDLNEELVDLIKTKQLISFLKKWNTTVKQVVKIHKKLDDVKTFVENSQIRCGMVRFGLGFYPWKPDRCRFGFL